MSDEKTFFQMRVAATFTRQLDNLRKAEEDLPTRSEMVRRLVEAAHDRLGKKVKR